MRFLLPSYQIITSHGPLTLPVGIEMLRVIEYMARISHGSEGAQTEDSWQRFISSVVLSHGDYSVIEHVGFTVIFKVNRGVTHEKVRHRISSFTQSSTRFINYSKPGHEAEYIPSCAVRPEHLSEWEADLGVADTIYQKWLKRGYAPQIARDHLPNALAATIAVTNNLRSWRHVFIMRTTKETHPDMRKVMIPLLKEVQASIPLLFDDIEPEQKQSEAMKKAR